MIELEYYEFSNSNEIKDLEKNDNQWMLKSLGLRLSTVAAHWNHLGD